VLYPDEPVTTRTIVTSHPGVTCDLCGRRLLRGERPDVFLGGGQRYTVCELCATRATQEGWRRESEPVEPEPAGSGWRGRRPQRGRSLLGRLGWPGGDRTAPPARAAREPDGVAEADGAEDRGLAPGADALDREWDGIGGEWAASTHEWAIAGRPQPDDGSGAEQGAADAGGAGQTAPDEGDSGQTAADAGSAEVSGPGEHGGGLSQSGAPATASPRRAPARVAQGDLLRALEVFNAGEHPRRIAGVARALGPACVKVAPLADAPHTVAILAAWELCWYRYEVDLDAAASGARLAAEGMELEELPAEDRVANAAADERGELALLPAS
jgi:hypothetical protein